MSIDPRARLHWIRNVRRGLLARSSIIRKLEREQWDSVQDIAYEVNLAAATVLYHLHHMHREGIVERQEGGRKWGMSIRHQASLSDYMQLDKLRNKNEAWKTKRREIRPKTKSTRMDPAR